MEYVIVGIYDVSSKSNENALPRTNTRGGAFSDPESPLKKQGNIVTKGEFFRTEHGKRLEVYPFKD